MRNLGGRSLKGVGANLARFAPSPTREACLLSRTRRMKRRSPVRSWTRTARRLGLACWPASFTRPRWKSVRAIRSCASIAERRIAIRTSSRGRLLVLRFDGSEGTRWLAANFGEPVEVTLRGADRPKIVVASNEGRFGGNGVEATVSGNRLQMPAHSAVWLSQSR